MKIENKAYIIGRAEQRKVTEPWLKLWAQDTITDTDMITMHEAEYKCYSWIMCLAHIHKRKGYIPGISEELLLNLANISQEGRVKIAGLFDRWVKIGRLVKYEDGYILHGFKERQESIKTGAERTREWRERDSIKLPLRHK